MALAKLEIIPEEGSKQPSFKVMFNPTELKYSRSVTWQDPQPALGISSGLHFSGSTPQTLSLDLFFDTYEKHPTADDQPAKGLGDAINGALSSFAAGLFGAEDSETTSVLDAMKPLLALADIEKELHRPPRCTLKWGGTTLFDGVLQQANATLTLFLADGTPVRATVSCTLQEWARGPSELHSPDVVKRHLVQQGDTLMALACTYYNDRGQWRRIADANRLENPRILTPGQYLTIPKIV